MVEHAIRHNTYYVADGRKLRTKHVTVKLPQLCRSAFGLKIIQKLNQIMIRRENRPSPFAPVILKYASSYHYFLCDYQDNNRVVVSQNGTVEQTNDYYAYGGQWGNTSTNQGFQPFKYNGKELDRVHGLDWYDYGARQRRECI